MLTSRSAIGRDLAAAILTVALAIPCGIAVGSKPSATVLVAVVGVGALACLLLPLRHLPALLLAVTIVIPSMVLEGFIGSGQARAVAVICVLALVRVLLARTRTAVPGSLPLAVCAATALTLMTALIASSRPASQVGNSSDLVRTLSYPAAAIVGFIGAVAARAGRDSLTIARACAWLGLLAALLSVWYWAWKKAGVPPPSHGLFQDVAASTQFPTRSTFPFVEDSPNLGAVMFVLLAAFAAPPLLLGSRSRGRDRVLGLAVVTAALAGVLTTESRTGLIAAGAATFTYLILLKRAGGRRSIVLVIMGLLASVAVYVFGTFPTERASGDTLAQRAGIWGQALRSFLDQPIIGHGYEYSLVGNFTQRGAVGTTSLPISTHGDLLSALVDGGVVGAAVFVGILGLMFAVAWRSMDDPATRPFGIGYACMLIAFVIGGLDNTLTQSAAVVTFEWLTFGVMVGIAQRPRRRPESPDPNRPRRRASERRTGYVHRPNRGLPPGEVTACAG